MQLYALSMIKLRHKKATPAGKRVAFGKELKVKAKPACKVVKCFAPKSLKSAGDLDAKPRVLSSNYQGPTNIKKRVCNYLRF